MIRRAWARAWRQPTLTLTAVILLAFGVGANLTGYTLFVGVLQDPLHLRDGKRLVFAFQVDRKSGMMYSPPLVLAGKWQGAKRSFEQMGAIVAHPYSYSTEDGTFRIEGAIVSPTLLQMLDTRVRLGRAFVAADSEPGAPPVVILSVHFWRDRWGGNPDVVGRSLTLDGKLFTIIGVAQSTLGSLGPVRAADLWTPLSSEIARDGAKSPGVASVIGILRPGATDGEATSELDGILREVGLAAGKADPLREVGSRVLHPKDLVAPGVRTATTGLLVAVWLILALCLTNLAGLFATQALAGRRDVAVVSALGASRFQVARELVLETAIPGVLGSALGFLLAVQALRAASHVRLGQVRQLSTLRVDGGIVVYTVLITVLASVVLALVRSLAVGQESLVDSIKGRLTSQKRTVGWRRIQGGFVAGQVAVATILLCGSGVLIKTLLGLRELDLGFDPTGVGGIHIVLSGSRYDAPEARAAVWAELRSGLQANSGASAMSWASSIPTDYGIMVGAAIDAEGTQLATTDRTTVWSGWDVDQNFFRVLHIPIVQGRNFSYDDESSAEPQVVIVEQGLARRIWGSTSPVGKRLRTSEDGDWLRVVGVAGDVAADGFVAHPPYPKLYFPLSRSTSQRRGWLVFGVPPGRDSRAFASEFVSQIRSLDSSVPVEGTSTLSGLLAATLTLPLVYTAVATVLATIAALLTAVAVFGLTKNLVQQRTKELAIRIAVGSTPHEAVSLVVRDGLAATLTGLVVGGAVFIATGHLLSRLLFGVSPVDAGTLAIVGLGLLATGAIASYVPARRAAAVDPIGVLRFG